MLRANRDTLIETGIGGRSSTITCQSSKYASFTETKTVGLQRKEKLQMHEKGVWQGVHYSSLTVAEERGFIGSSSYA